MDPAAQRLEGRGAGGLLVLVPVGIGHAPQRRVIAHLLRPFEVIVCVGALRRAVKRVDRASGHLPVLRGQAVQLLCKPRLGHLGHIGVACGVVADQVAFVPHAPGKRGRRVQKAADHEESRRNVVRLEHVQDLGRVAVLIATVKGKVKGLAVRVTHIVRAVLCERLDAVLARGRLARAIPIPQPPVGRPGCGGQHRARTYGAQQPFSCLSHIASSLLPAGGGLFSSIPDLQHRLKRCARPARM